VDDGCVETTDTLTPRMKFHLIGTVKRLNIEHRTSNIEHPILMTLRFIDLKTSEPQNPPKADKFQRVDSLCSVFFKLTEFIIRCSMFDVHFLVDPLYESSQGQSFS